MPSKKRSTSSSEKNISIGRDVVNSVVIAGDNNIVNYFKGDYVSLKEHYIPPDSVFQRVRVDDFVGRDWLTVQVDAFLNDSQRKSGAFLLIGDAGVGKTSFMAHLVKERGYLHLFAEQVPGQAMLQRAIQSLGSQLVTRYQIDPYKDRDTLIQGTVFPDFLERLLRMAAGKLTDGGKIVIVCDALDEAGTFPDGNVFGLPNVLPDGVYLILSQRPVNVKLPNLEPLTVRLEAQGADNLQDMEKYLRAVAQRASVADQLRAKNYSDTFFIQTLKEKSLGVWMYLHYVIKEIEQGSRAPLELEALPTGLVGYYADFWGDWRMGRKGRGEGEKAWDALYAPLLTTLAAAQEAITIGTLIQWADANADEDEVTRLVAEDWRAFIEEKEAGAETRYKPYHLSFADFIAGRADSEKLPPAQKNLVRDLAKRTVKAHQRIVQVFEAECHGQWEKLVEREYPRLYLSAHLNGAGDYETLRILLTEGDEKIKWAEAREKKEETYAGYLNDLTCVWAYAEREQNYALAIRCMLIENSIHSLAENIPPELLTEFAKTGEWSYAKCLSLIRLKGDSEDKAESLKQIVLNLPLSLFKESRSITQGVKDDSDRADFLAALAPYLNDYLNDYLNFPPSLFKESLSITQGIKDDSDRADSLAALAPYLNDYLKAQALVSAREIKDGYFRARALVALTSNRDNKAILPEEIQDLLVSARDQRYSSLRALALVTLIPLVPEDEKPLIIQEALSAEEECEDALTRAYIMADLAPYLDEDTKRLVFKEILSNAQNYEPLTRAYTIAEIKPYVNDEIKKQISNEALSIIHEKFTDELVHAYALNVIFPCLDDKNKLLVRGEALSIVHGKFLDGLIRVYALREIIPLLDDNNKPPIIQEALSTARKIKKGILRARGLVTLIQYVDNDRRLPVLQEALSAAQELNDNSEQIIALSALIPRLNIEVKPLVLHSALSIVREIRDELERASALVTLVPYLESKRRIWAVQYIIFSAFKIQSVSERAKLFSTLMPCLSSFLRIWVLKFALSNARKIENEPERASVLSAIIPYLGGTQRTRVLEETLSATHKFDDESDAVKFILDELIPHLPDELREQTTQEGLLIAHKIQDETVRCLTLFRLSFCLNNDETRILVFQDILAIARDSGNELAPRLAAFMEEFTKWIERLKQDNAVIYEMKEIFDNLRADFAFISNDDLKETLFSTSEIEEIKETINKWRQISFEGLDKVFLPFIKLVAQSARSYGFEVVGALTPALVHFSGEEIVPELYRAIQDTARWWP